MLRRSYDFNHPTFLLGELSRFGLLPRELTKQVAKRHAALAMRAPNDAVDLLGSASIRLLPKSHQLR